mgnify:CR=1 FL=1
MGRSTGSVKGCHGVRCLLLLASGCPGSLFCLHLCRGDVRVLFFVVLQELSGCQSFSLKGIM